MKLLMLLFSNFQLDRNGVFYLHKFPSNCIPKVGFGLGKLLLDIVLILIFVVYFFLSANIEHSHSADLMLDHVFALISSTCFMQIISSWQLLIHDDIVLTIIYCLYLSEVLKQVWDLSDQDNDSMLSLREFCTALYLMERYREGRPPPAVLPNSIMFDLPTPGQTTTNYSNAAWRPTSGTLPHYESFSLYQLAQFVENEPLPLTFFLFFYFSI